MRDAIEFVLATVCFFVVVLALYAAASAEQHSTTDRKRAIAECEQHGGLAVVLAGEVSSRGIGCAQPLGQ